MRIFAANVWFFTQLFNFIRDPSLSMPVIFIPFKQACVCIMRYKLCVHYLTLDMLLGIARGYQQRHIECAVRYTCMKYKNSIAQTPWNADFPPFSHSIQFISLHEPRRQLKSYYSPSCYVPFALPHSTCAAGCAVRVEYVNPSALRYSDSSWSKGDDLKEEK